MAWVKYVLINKFGWTTNQLRRQRLDDIFELLTCMDVESRVAEARKNAKGGGGL